MKRILIIGATSGIGRALAEIYAGSDNIVGVTGRRTALLQQCSDMFPERILYAEHDISGNCNSGIFNDLVRRLGGLDMLIISAGTGRKNPSLEFQTEYETIAVNIIGFTEMATLGCRYFERQGSGHLIGISSVAALRGIAVCPAYSASKAYISNYCEALRKKYKKNKTNITVTEIRPGFVDTRMATGEGLFWVASVEKAAQQIAAAIRSKKSVAYVTKRWRVVALVLKALPRKLYNRM